MNFKALAFAIVGAVIAAFYGLEAVLAYQAGGFSAPMLVKVAICGVATYFFLRNAARVRKCSPHDGPVNEA
jgi:hypothetical protein